MSEQVERFMLGGTDGCRGLFTEDQTPQLDSINEAMASGLTHALIEYQQEQLVSGPVVVAQDTRESGEALRRAAIDCASALGVKVVDLNVAPTPMAQKVAEKVGAMATVVLTASHNPASHNGWKGMLGNRKPSKDESQEISDRFWTYWEQAQGGLAIPAARRHSVYEDNGAYTDWYRSRIVRDTREQFGHEKPLDGKIIVVDGAFGAARNITPEVLKSLGAKVEEFSCDDGVINEGCGAADLSGLRKYLLERPNLLKDPNFLGAVANDGDADRMMGIGVVHRDGKPELVEVNGNHVMEVLAQGEIGIVGTEYTNTGMVRRLEKEGISFEYCANGDLYVTEALQSKQKAGLGWRRGGEFTGHHVDLDWLSSGDGVRMAAWFASWAVKHGKTFGEIQQEMPLWPEVMTKVEFPGPKRKTIMENRDVKDILAVSRAELREDGRLVVRPSGTEPVVRIWGEGGDERQIRGIVRRIEEVIRRKAW